MNLNLYQHGVAAKQISRSGGKQCAFVGGKQEQCILEGEIKQQYTLEGDWVESSFKRRPHYLSPSKKTHFTGCSHVIRKEGGANHDNF